MEEVTLDIHEEGRECKDKSECLVCCEKLGTPEVLANLETPASIYVKKIINEISERKVKSIHPRLGMGKTEYPVLKGGSGTTLETMKKAGTLEVLANLGTPASIYVKKDINEDNREMKVKSPHRRLGMGKTEYPAFKGGSGTPVETMKKAGTLSSIDVKEDISGEFVQMKSRPPCSLGKTEIFKGGMGTPVEGMENARTPTLGYVKKAETPGSFTQSSPCRHLVDTMTPESGSKSEECYQLPSKRIVRSLFSHKTSSPKKLWLQKVESEGIVCCEDQSNICQILDVSPASNKLTTTKGYFWVSPPEFKCPGGKITPNKETWRLYIVAKQRQPLCMLIPATVQLTVESLSGATQVMFKQLGYSSVPYKV